MADETLPVGQAGNKKRLKDMGDTTVAEVVYAGGSALPTGGTPTAGTLAATTVAAALGASTAAKEVLVQADPGNTPDILLGDATSQPIRLTPGMSAVVPTSNLNLLYAKTSSATGTVNWIVVA